jgi:hypothetical protein
VADVVLRAGREDTRKEVAVKKALMKYEKRFPKAEARVVKAILGRYETCEIAVALASDKGWEMYDKAVDAEERAVRALLKLREGERK